MITIYKLRTHLAVLTTAATLATFATEQSAIAQQSINTTPGNSSPADADLNGTCYALPVSEVLIPNQGGSFHVEISGIFPTIARFPEWVRLKNTVTRVDGLEIAYSKNTVMVTPDKGVSGGVHACKHPSRS